MIKLRNALGIVAGYKIVFRTDGVDGAEVLTVESTDYFAELSLTMNSGISGGDFSLSIFGMTTKDLQLLAQAKNSLIAEVHLFWRDTVSMILDKPDTAAVAYFAVTSLNRRVQGLQHVTILKGQDAIFHLLKTNDLGKQVSKPTMDEAIREALTQLGLVEHETFMLCSNEQTGANGPANYEIPTGFSGPSALRKLNEYLEDMTGLRGRGMCLIRDGQLHIGPTRGIPHNTAGAGVSVSATLNPDDVTVIGEEQGFIASEFINTIQGRDNVRTSMAGNADIKPGDVISVPRPDAGTDSLGLIDLPSDIAGLFTNEKAVNDVERVSLYVNSVTHKLDKKNGFKTTASGVAVSDDLGLWDEAETPAEGGSSSTRRNSLAAERANGSLRGMMRGITQAEIMNSFGTYVAEVRSFSPQSEGGTNTIAQLETVVRGLKEPDGQSRLARRSDIDRTNDVLAGVPYATPFAWGAFGLALPRYPGMRVVLTHNQFESNDPVEIGALWRTDTAESAQGPKNAEAGDWWLSLPVDAVQSDPADGEPVSVPENTKAVHDITDAQGNRLIEAGQFTIRVKSKNSLGVGGERPELAGEPESILIEQSDQGAKIELTKEGKIIMHAPGGMEINADGVSVTLSGGNFDVS